MFTIKPEIENLANFKEFAEKYVLTKNDLIITNKFVLEPHLEDELSCQCLYQEEFGSGEPTDEMINTMLSKIEDSSFNRIIAVGGGTVIDIAKLFVFGTSINCEKIFSEIERLEPQKDLIIIPTTCGTGSEVTPISIVEFKVLKTKKGINSPKLFAHSVVLIPSMLSTLPYGVFATSSIDALIHAVESCVSPKADDFSVAFSQKAIEMILTGYQNNVLVNDKKLPPIDELNKFLIASTMAGIAFGNAGCAAVHALSYPIGGNYHVPHGKANYMVFKEVYVEYIKANANLKFLEEIIAGVLKTARQKVWEELFSLLDRVLDKPPLSDYGFDSSTAKEFAKSVIDNQQRLLANNPVELSISQIEDIYLRCM